MIVTGNSCAGKTRTLYQAVCGTALRDWFIATPQTPARITALLADPQVLTNTIVWLDELQKLLPATAEGDAAARAVIDLLNRTNEDGPVALLATIWPSTNGNYNILMPATRLWATT